jgi:hypothetical protein
MRDPRRLLAAIVITSLSGLPTVAEAKMTKTFTYSLNSVWSATIRLIRADKGYKINDKDKENGYILFVYPGAGSVKECPASLEMYSFVDDGGLEKVRIRLSIAHQPSYIILNFLEQIERKLKDDYGEPPAPRKARRKKPQKEKGKETKKDKG